MTLAGWKQTSGIAAPTAEQSEAASDASTDTSLVPNDAPPANPHTVETTASSQYEPATLSQYEPAPLPAAVAVVPAVPIPSWDTPVQRLTPMQPVALQPTFTPPQPQPQYGQPQQFGQPQLFPPHAQLSQPHQIPQPPPFQFPSGPPGATGQIAYQTQPGAPIYVAGKQGSSAGIIAAVVLGLILFVSVGIIGAVSLLGQKVKTNFSAITNTLPSAPPVQSYGAAASSLTAFESANGLTESDIIDRNTYGPVGFPVGEECAVFEPDTASYAAVYCGSGKMNARLITVGFVTAGESNSVVEESCHRIAKSIVGPIIEAKDLLLVTYDSGSVECFITSSPDFVVVPAITEAQLGSQSNVEFEGIANTLP
jgi:Flp pilus assembly pilin Flp